MLFLCKSSMLIKLNILLLNSVFLTKKRHQSMFRVLGYFGESFSHLSHLESQSPLTLNSTIFFPAIKISHAFFKVSFNTAQQN